MSNKPTYSFPLGRQQYIGLARYCARYALILLALLSGISHSAAFASDASSDPVFDSVAVFKGQGADHNLKEVPGAILSGNVLWESSYFNAIGLSANKKTLGDSFELMQGTPFASIRQGYELVLLQHHGLQNNTEAGLAYSLNSPDLHLGMMSVNFRAGIGLSQSFGTPSYEDGSKEDPTKRYNTQQLMLFEFEWHIHGLENLALVTRVHHRSGVYGLIAPKHVGSNFLAAGIRYNF